MPKINVYLPDELAAAVKEAKIPVSVICQLALQRNLEDISMMSRTRLSVDGPWPQSGLLGRFSPRARHALVAAIAEAESVPHDYVGTEHLLIGMLADPDNLASKALIAMDVEPIDVQAEVRASLGPPTAKSEGRVPFNEYAKSSLATALTEALNLRHNYIGCEHLLIGILATEQGLGSIVMRRMGIELPATRRAVVALVDGAVRARTEQLPPPGSDAGPSDAAPDKLDQILRRLEAIEERLAS